MDGKAIEGELTVGRGINAFAIAVKISGWHSLWNLEGDEGPRRGWWASLCEIRPPMLHPVGLFPLSLFLPGSHSHAKSSPFSLGPALNNLSTSSTEGVGLLVALC